MLSGILNSVRAVEVNIAIMRVFVKFRQILAGLEALDTDVVFMVEHDVLYHPSHFDFTPPERDIFYYNRNTWKVNAETGHAVFYLCDQCEAKYGKLANSVLQAEIDANTTPG